MSAASTQRKRPEERAANGGRRAGASWKKDPEGRRQRVLDAAEQLFAQHGYASVSTSDVARAAGVAEGNVFHYFGSKPGLLRAVGERYGAGFAAAMFSRLEPVATVETVEKAIVRAFDFVERSWPGFGLFLLSDDPSAAPLAQKANRKVVTRAVEDALDAWIAAGLIEVDAPVVAELLFGLVESALRACFAEHAGAQRERYAAQTVAAVSRILGIGGGRV